MNFFLIQLFNIKEEYVFTSFKLNSKLTIKKFNIAQ